jgi:hypothetical protein
MGDPYNPVGTLDMPGISFDGGITWVRRELENDDWYRCEPPKEAGLVSHDAWREHLEAARKRWSKRKNA